VTVGLRYSIHTLLFMAAQATTLFGSAGRIDIIEFWLYVAISVSILALSPAFLDPDLLRERMQPGGHRVGLRFLPVLIVVFLHWLLAGLDRGRLHLSDTVPSVLEAVALTLFATAWIVCIWVMYRNPFFSSIPRIQWERGHRVITDGPYGFIQHPGYATALVAAVTSGVALGSWISTFIAPVSLVLIVRRIMIEDRMLRRDLPGYVNYAERVRYRLVPGIW
jgi:protein-S-isoprenylcysteine O-methyltransferase Ste14